MSKFMTGVLATVTALSLSACALTDATREAANARANELVKERFAFEFNCPKDQVQTTMLAFELGAAGCNQRKMYKVVCPGTVFGINPANCFIPESSTDNLMLR